MATNKNITMKQFNGVDYDTLYPKTTVSQVEGAYGKNEVDAAIAAADPMGTWKYAGKITKISLDSKGAKNKNYVTIIDYGESSGFCTELSKIAIKINNVASSLPSPLFLSCMTQTEDGAYEYSGSMSLANYKPNLNADMLVGGVWEIIKGTTSYQGGTENGEIYLAGITGFFSSGVQIGSFVFPQGKKIKKIGITLDYSGGQGNVPCDIDVYIKTTK